MAPEGRSGQILTFLPSRPPQRFDVNSARNNHLLNSTTMPVGNVIQFLFCFYNMVTDGWQLWACDLKIEAFGFALMWLPWGAGVSQRTLPPQR